VYREEWVSRGDWLGTGNRKGGWRPFVEAREFAQSLKLKSSEEWQQYLMGEMPGLPPKPDDVPRTPLKVYREQWVSWGDWLGTGNVHRREWRPFAEAREFVRSLRLKSRTEWAEYAKGDMPGLPPKPDDVPAAPHSAYRDEWVSMGDWLGKS
jgi:hypothetical protein